MIWQEHLTTTNVPPYQQGTLCYYGSRLLINNKKSSVFLVSYTVKTSKTKNALSDV